MKRNPSISPDISNDARITEKRHWAALALIRFILAMSVVFVHIGQFYRLDEWPQWSKTVTDWAFQIVMAFFLISGYSIAASLDKSSEGFFMRRARRIFPIFWLCLAVSLIPFFFVPSWTVPSGAYVYSTPTLLQVILNACCLQTVWTPAILTFGASWSLMPEVAYYAMAKAFHKIPAATVPIIIGASLWFYIRQFSIWPAAPFHPELGRVVFILAWVWLVGFYHRKSNTLVSKGMVCAVPIILYWFNIHRGGHIHAWSPLLLLTCFALVMRMKIPSRYIAVGDKLGDLSYPLYLIHYVCVSAAWLVFKDINYVFAVGIPLSLVAAYACVVIDSRIKRRGPNSSVTIPDLGKGAVARECSR